MNWTKRGHIFAPSGSRAWARSYAAFPTPQLEDDRLRVYFSSLDDDKRGRTGFVDLDPDDPGRVVDECEEPVLDIGATGLFDDCGANVFSVVGNGASASLYYQGWQRTETVPLIFSGLATATGDGGTFRKVSRTPILDRREDDPYLRGAPFVIRQDDAFRMWYVSCSRWVQDAHGLNYRVGIRHAVSSDGIEWHADPEPCLAPDPPNEYALGRPCVVVVDGIYRMWYSIRSFDRPYRIGHAISADGLVWQRLDAETGLEPSPDGWDSEMVCYGHVTVLGNRVLMFYNGNQHGLTGFGYAEGSLGDLTEDVG